MTDRPRLEVPAMGQNAPGNAGELVGECNRQNVVMEPLLGGLDPGLEPVPLPALWSDEDDPRRLHEEDPQIAVATFGYLAQDRAVAG